MMFTIVLIKFYTLPCRFVLKTSFLTPQDQGEKTFNIVKSAKDNWFYKQVSVKGSLTTGIKILASLRYDEYKNFLEVGKGGCGLSSLQPPNLPDLYFSTGNVPFRRAGEKNPLKFFRPSQSVLGRSQIASTWGVVTPFKMAIV
ncbi:hypothetical protein CEXT_306941 [Caerostris extrusa]|uniref:Uncharacterized protein n=1 Tax=Caerostris extrusa TaxID=172846 RepID=A0AAV4XVP2_CAEEX|nr:hypothetical protein CEXT_306941 [Caerostris extrusa]